ncbi:type I-B CRISPR-associated protein Cas5b [Athalassotoga saccharophila]|uniref:type I-B CRISPR-associated protein Cas5b n=1 Tax=Athalassotoga saccharophila TaxID=1441386 RepID=UPI00137A46E0|nr:type I-B CRISPR-associated protein Cas5b [Athalassotoga saccharophila]BBJ28654.1 CRISPR-associated protein Cas5, hmari subtype [Athalassotoga saccharophila]
MEKISVFEVSSRFGVFRKPYTTTSSLTYDFPPRTAIIGMIAAVLGWGNDDQNHYISFFKEFKVAVKILKPIQKKSTTFKNLNTKQNAPSPNILTLTEMIYNPSYKLYISWEESKLLTLKNKIINRESFYTPYLGTASNIAKIEYIGDFPIQWVKPQTEVIVSSVVPKIDNLIFKPMDDQKYIFDTLPYEIDEKRNFVSNRDYIYNPNLGGIKVVVGDEETVFRVNDDYLIFM